MHNVEHTMYASVYIYSVHSVWFRFAMYKNALLFICTFFMLAAATVANIKIRYDAKAPQFAIFGTRDICVLYQGADPALNLTGAKN